MASKQMESPSLDSHDMNLGSKLYMHTFQGEWEEVEKLYERKREVWIAEITSSGDTALHMAINEDKEDVVVKLVDIIVEAARRQEDHRVKPEEALRKANEVKDTPLHRAAARGSVKMCDSIVEAATKMSVDLFFLTNEWGETPLFVAALYNRKDAFLYLFDKARDIHGAEVDLLTTSFNGDTILHSAIRREHYDLAFHILQLCPDLVGRYNEKGMSPLHILASKPSAFTSGYHLSWWQAIIYYCIKVDSLKYDGDRPTTDQTESSAEFDVSENYLTCRQFLLGRKVKRDPENQSRVEGNVPQNWDTCFQFLFMVLQNLFGLLSFGKAFYEIIEARRKHVWSVQILDQLMKDPGKTYMTKGGGDPGPSDSGALTDSPERLLETLKTENKKGDKNKDGDNDPEAPMTALLVAARKGVVEVVNKILLRLPVSIHDTSSMRKNIVMIAVENRQPRILEVLYTHLYGKLKKPQLWRDLLLAVDTEDNTILHLAAKYDQSGESHPWQIHGSAMQMQWEVKWYEFDVVELDEYLHRVKLYAPPHFVFLTNKKDKTPGQIFTKDHQELVERSSGWLKDTSESCSVVAALVAGVSFATSSQVPGGTDYETGKPRLEGQSPFELFAVTGLIGLCFSVTALVMFLSILTSRKQPKDFRRNLPLKLLLGLSSLFVSIASMLISFCAAHFFVLEDKFKKGVFPIYAATCLPASFYAIGQFPLYVDLLKSIVRSVPQSHHFGNL